MISAQIPKAAMLLDTFERSAFKSIMQEILATFNATPFGEAMAGSGFECVNELFDGDYPAKSDGSNTTFTLSEL